MEHRVSIVTTSATPTAVVREATTWQRFPTQWGAMLEEVWAHVRAAGLETGRNVMVYEDDAPTVQVGVEVGGTFAPSGRVVPSVLPEGRAATTVAPGPVSVAGLEAAHRAVVDWCDAHGHERTGVRWEVYGHERGDPEGFDTAVYWLVVSSS